MLAAVARPRGGVSSVVRSQCLYVAAANTVRRRATEDGHTAPLRSTHSSHLSLDTDHLQCGVLKSGSVTDGAECLAR